MATLGDAWVVIRAITTQLKGDVKKGLDEAAQEADSSAAKTGGNYSKTLGKEIERGIERDVGSKISEGLNKGYKDSDGDRDGKSLSAKILKGFLGGLAAGGKGAGPILMQGLVGASLGAGIAGLVGGAVTGIDALAAGLTGLVAVLGQTIPLLSVGMAAGLGALVQGAGVAMLFLKDLTASAKNVPPAAAEARKSFQDFSKSFKEMVAEIGTTTVFPALNGFFKQLSGGSLPLLKNALTETAQALAGIIDQFTAALKNPFFSNNLATIFSTNATSIKNLGTVLVNLVQGFAALFAAASPFINEFTGWLAGLSAHFAALEHVKQLNGQLNQSFATAATTLKTLGSLLSGLGSIFGSVLKAALPLGQAMLGSWAAGAQGLAGYLKSAEGIKKLGNFFDPNGQVAKNLQAIGGAVKSLLGGIGQLAQNKGWEDFARGIQEVVPGLVKVLGSAEGAIGHVAKALGDAFASPAGQAGIKAISTGVTDFGNALGKLGPAIGPILQIVGQLISNLSNALGPAFDTLSRVLPQLVGPFNQIGQAIGKVLLSAVQAIAPLLPQLAQALASIAQIGASVLGPAFTVAGAALKLLLDILVPLLNILKPLAPVIAAVGAAFLTWKVLSTIGGTLQQMGGFMQFASQAGGTLAGTIGKAGSVLSGLGTALPIVGTAVALIGTAFALAKQQIQDWGTALLKGGDAAAHASVQMSGINDFLTKGATGFASQVTGVKTWADAMGVGTNAAKNAKQAMQDQLDQMDPLSRAQAMLSQATNNYDSAVGHLGPNSMLAIGYHQQMAYWAGQVQQKSMEEALAQGNLASAAGMVAQNMYGELAAHQALVGASTATQSSVLGLEQAQNSLLQTQKQFPKNSLELQQSQIGVQQAVQGVIATASQSAQTWATQAVKAGQFTKDANGMAQAVAEGMQVQRAELQKLADAIPAGPIHDAVQGAINDFSKLANLPPATPQVDIDTANFDNGITGVKPAMDSVDKTKATPIIGVPDLTGLNAGVTDAKVTLAGLANTPVKPVADIDWTKVAAGVAGAKGVTADLAAQTPTPKANLNPTGFNTVAGQVTAGILGLTNSTATPKATMNPSSFNAINGIVNGALANLNAYVARPYITAIDQATTTIGRVQAALTALHDKAITVTTYNKMVSTGPAGLGLANAGPHAMGNIVHAFSSGGFQAMAAGIAQVVPPNSWRIIGDRIRDDEAYIPINNSARSRQILQQTATRMGYLLAAPDAAAAAQTASTPSSGAYIPVTVYPAAQMDEAALGRKVGQEIAWQLRKI